MARDRRLNEHPRIGVVGAGAMGLSLAALLGRTLDVTLVARDPLAADALRREGAVVEGLMTARSVPRVVTSVSALADAAPLHAVFVATKTTAIDGVACELRPVLDALGGPDPAPAVISFQNGIESGRTLMERLGHPRVLRMVLNYGATRTGLNRAKVTLDRPPHFIGGPGDDATASSLAATLTACGLPTEHAPDIEPAVWTKGVINAAMNPVAALTDASVGEVLDSPARELVARLMEEGLDVAAAEGIDLGADAVERMWTGLEAARRHTPSMVGDIRGGRPSEVGQLNRQIIAHAQRVGVPVPAHQCIASLIDAFDWRVFRRGHG